jgi:hypothetical protein
MGLFGHVCAMAGLIRNGSAAKPSVRRLIMMRFLTLTPS